MNVFPTLRLPSLSLCVALVACAGTAEPPATTVVRTPAPQGYQKTIDNYFAFKIRNPQKNAQINVSRPEPGGCALDGHASSIRGWVVPVVYETRSGELTGRETIRINAKPYYFWFLGNTIAGVTPRIELCPGIGSAFDDAAPAGDVARAVQPAALSAAAPPDPTRRERVDATEPAKADAAQARVLAPRPDKGASAQAKKKTGKAAGGARKVRKPLARPG